MRRGTRHELLPGHGQTTATLRSSPAEHTATAGRAHPRTESVRLFAMAIVWLEGALHLNQAPRQRRELISITKAYTSVNGPDMSQKTVSLRASPIPLRRSSGPSQTHCGGTTAVLQSGPCGRTAGLPLPKFSTIVEKLWKVDKFYDLSFLSMPRIPSFSGQIRKFARFCSFVHRFSPLQRFPRDSRLADRTGSIKSVRAATAALECIWTFATNRYAPI